MPAKEFLQLNLHLIYEKHQENFEYTNKFPHMQIS